MILEAGRPLRDRGIGEITHSDGRLPFLPCMHEAALWIESLIDDLRPAFTGDEASSIWFLTFLLTLDLTSYSPLLLSLLLLRSILVL